MKTYLKTKNNHNCQKIELYGSPTTKEIKKKHSSRLVGGAETHGVGGHIIITLPKMKQKERILEAAREKNTVTCKEFP